MIDREQYAPGPISAAQVRKDGEKWTLILVRELRHPPEKVWRALTDPVHLREWAPFVVDGSLDTVGAKVNLTWVGNPKPIETTVTRADAPELLEYGDIRWELEATGSGTRLTLWHSIDRRFIAWGAAGWHISFDVLDHLLGGTPIGRLAGGDAMQSAAWQRLVGEYAKQFGVELPKWSPPAAQK
ncbi:MAG TPA: SRPBCC domain-containing protein [Bryobacteraceae bacterium]|nr:SRPBCC domain-containing protein [Bryobacteraceae bacterium]